MARQAPLAEADRHRIAEEVKEALILLRISDSELARRAGVDQPMVFNVKNERIRKRTPRVRRLELYVHMILGRPDETADRVQQAIRAYLAAGGDVEVLCSSIEILAKAFGGPRD
jgi:hypothetical protein